MRKFLWLSFSLIALSACSTMPNTYNQSELAQGKRYFDQGYYKKAMQQLIPLACHGVAEAQYAIGYMYYYGLGVAQDTDVGYGWMQLAAKNGSKPAQNAINSMAVTPSKH
jgi:TPR repeat protein